MAAPMIATAARLLREQGFAAKATFVDIESTPMGAPEMINAKHGHGKNWSKRFAMAELYAGQAGNLELLTGNRAQIAKATAAFHVLREHVPPRPDEKDMSINHSSLVYIIGPDTLVAGYGYHDASSEVLVDLVKQLDGAKRKKVDLTAVRRRYVRGACGE